MTPAQQARRLEWHPFAGGYPDDGDTATIRSFTGKRAVYLVCDVVKQIKRYKDGVWETIPYSHYPKANETKLEKRFEVEQKMKRIL